jgi:hypothetical protein
MTMTGSKKFNLQVGYLWSVHDFKAYNIFFRMELQWNFDMSIMYEGHILFLSSIGGGGEEISYFDCHRCFLPWITHLGWTTTHSRRLILSYRDCQGI